MIETKHYIGDGIHVEIVKNCLILYTYDGTRITNKIYLVHDTAEELMKHLKIFLKASLGVEP